VIALFIVDTTPTRCRRAVFAVWSRPLEMDSHLGDKIHDTVPITAHFPYPKPDRMVDAKMIVKFLNGLASCESEPLNIHLLEAQSVLQSFAKAESLHS
jgi:hypothetical protein